MNIVRGRTDVRWAPARFNYAISRLVVLAVAPFIAPKEDPNAVLIVDRNQNSVESWFVSVWVVATLTAYFDVLLQRIMPATAAVIPAILLALAMTQVAFVLSGLAFAPIAHRLVPTGDRDNTRVTSAFLFVELAVPAAWMATLPHWPHFVGFFYFAVIGANALAAIPARLLGRRIAELKRMRGVPD